MPSFYTNSTTNSTTNATYTNSLYFKTPWGSDMVCINALSTNASDGSGAMSVNFIHEALTGNRASSNTPGAGVSGSGYTALASNSTYSISGQALNNVFGGNFATKYTSLGVKQIAANMLQMRDPNTSSVNASFSYTGPLLGSGSLNGEIPAEYLGYAPYLVISEIGMSACLASKIGGGGSADWGFKLQPVIELYNPYPVPFTIPAGAFPRVMLRPTRLSCNMSWSGPNGNNLSGNFVFGSGASKPATWTYSWWFGLRTLSIMGWDHWGKYDLIYQANNGNSTIPPYSKIQTRLYLSPSIEEAFYTFIPLVPTPGNGGNITIHSVRDMKIQFGCVILLANSGNNVPNAASGYSNTIRDWVRGDEIGEMDVGFDSSKFPYEFKWNGSTLIIDPAFNVPTGANGTAAPIPTKSSQRISHLTKIPNSSNPAIAIDDSNRNWTTTNSTISGNWLASGTSWVTPTSSNFGHLGRSNSTTTDVSLAAPSASANFTTPSDPSPGDSVANAVYASTNASDMREPFLLTGNYSCPADLGLVPTNKRWRRLRMQMQPKKEVSTLYGGLGNQTFIPDWTMLDFMAFNDTGYRPTGNMVSWSQVAGEGGSYNLGAGTYDVAYGVDGRYAYRYGVSGTITFNNANFGDPYWGRGKYGYVITTTSANLTSSNASIKPQIRVNPNGKFRVATGPTPAPRTVGLKSLVKTIDTTAAIGSLADPMSGNSTSVGDKIRFMGNTGAASEVVAGNIANMTWSSQSAWNSQRNARSFPIDTYLLPSEVCEIAGVSDVVDQTDYNNTNSHFKWNEGRVSAILPGLTTCSSFFSIYAYAQVLDKAGNLESEALTKTMVEVEIPIYSNFLPNGTIIQPAYRIKKLYTQPIPLGQ